MRERLSTLLPSTGFLARLACRACGFYGAHGPSGFGAWRVKQAGLRLSGSLRQDPTPRVVRSHGVRLLVDGTSQVGRILLATGEYEVGTARVIDALLSPGDTFVDVGAHVGFFSVLAARRVGSNGRVLAFEPSPKTRDRLKRNVALNALTNVRVFGEALGDRRASMGLAVGPSDDSGLASLRVVERHGQTVAVDVVPFDEAFPLSERVAGIKIDVEGAECKVLTGMARHIAQHRPWIIAEITERFLREMGDSVSSLFATMSTFGYESFAIRDDECDAIADGIDLPPQFNGLFLPKSFETGHPGLRLRVQR